MTTKKLAASCKVPHGRKPSREKYADRKAIMRRGKTLAAAVVPIPDPQTPHPMPPYGGKCWQQSYREAQAYIRLAQKTAEQRQALIEYNSAWWANEDCRRGSPT